MKMNIQGAKIKVTPAIKSYVETKLVRLEKYFENPEEIDAKIIIRVQGINQIIEITVPTTKFTLRAEVSHSDLYAAIDLVIDKLERQITKNKDRIKKIKGSENFGISTSFKTDVDKNNAKIVKRKTVETKPMDEEEAILQMELINHDFFVFKNIDENCFSVTYKRKDGSYGIIDMK